VLAAVTTAAHQVPNADGFTKHERG
jgi:hypothetical protein